VGDRGLRRPELNTEALLALACLLSAILLGAAEFMDVFHLTPPGGEALEALDGFDRHHGALLVLSVFAIVALGIAVTTGSKPAAFAVAACGAIALLIFLIGDLPKANNVGTLNDSRQSFLDAEADPQNGFWFELLGSLLLTICGAALATLPADRINLFGREDAAPAPRTGAKTKPRKDAGQSAKRA